MSVVDIEARTRRTARARLLLVGDVKEWQAILPELRTEPEYADSVLDAIGRLGVSSGSLFAAVIIPDGSHASPKTSRHAAEAMKIVDPSVPVLRLAGAESDEHEVDGFDGALTVPIDPDALDDLVGAMVTAHGAAAPGETSGGNGVAGGHDGDGRGDGHEHGHEHGHGHGDGDGQGHERGDGHGHGHAEVDVAEAPRPGVESPHAPCPMPHATLDSPHAAPAAIGDTDLVDAVLSIDPLDDVPESGPESGPLLGRAIALIRQQTGWQDVSFDAEHDALVCPEASEVERLTWEGWLAQWLRLDRTHHDVTIAAFRDDLTGSWNRRYFNAFLERTLARARERRRVVTVMVFDIDDFKRYNDEFSHEAGDVILRETVALLDSVIRRCDRVCRIGGDEFAVVFADLDAPREAGSVHPDDVGAIARRFQQQINSMRFPKLGIDAPGTLSISAGLSAYPWDGQDAASLLRHADQRALESKRRGKNYITFGPDVAH